MKVDVKFLIERYEVGNGRFYCPYCHYEHSCKMVRFWCDDINNTMKDLLDGKEINVTCYHCKKTTTLKLGEEIDVKEIPLNPQHHFIVEYPNGESIRFNKYIHARMYADFYKKECRIIELSRALPKYTQQYKNWQWGKKIRYGEG